MFYLNHNDTSFCKAKRIHTLVFTTLLKSSYSKDTLFVIYIPLYPGPGRAGSKLSRALQASFSPATLSQVTGYRLFIWQTLLSKATYK